MNTCPRCLVTVEDENGRCPLCHGTIAAADGLPGAGIYPPAEMVKGPTESIITFFRRLIFFCNVVGIGVCILINALVWRGIAWSAIVAAGCFTLDALLHVILFSHANMAKRLFTMLIPTVTTVLTVEYTTGTHIWHWGLDYVVPFLLIGFTTALNLIAVIRYFRWNTYDFYILFLALLGIVPIILATTPLITVWWPSIASAGYSVATLIGLFLFSRRRTIDNLHRKFHI